MMHLMTSCISTGSPCFGRLPFWTCYVFTSIHSIVRYMGSSKHQKGSRTTKIWFYTFIRSSQVLLAMTVPIYRPYIGGGTTPGPQQLRNGPENWPVTPGPQPLQKRPTESALSKISKNLEKSWGTSNFTRRRCRNCIFFQHPPRVEKNAQNWRISNPFF